jgi:hypothetical protein
MCNGAGKDDDVFQMSEEYNSFQRLQQTLVGYAGLPSIVDYEKEKAFDAIN